MTQKFLEDGTVVPVTKVEAGPCVVAQVKDEEKDGYKAVQLGYGLKKRLTKPLRGHLKNLGNFRYLKEFGLSGGELKKGDRIDLSVFSVGDKVKVSGASKGKGFQGVVKRHGFSGAPASHGHKDQLRMPGSIGATGPQHVFKGMRMAGRMGGSQTSIKNLEIIDIDLDNNTVFIKGAVPGARGALVSIVGEGEIRASVRAESKKIEEKEIKEAKEAEQKENN